MQIPSLFAASALSATQTRHSGTAAANTSQGGASSAGAGSSGVVVSLSGTSRSAPATGYTASGASTSPMPMATIDYFSFGDDSSLGSPQGPTRLEYNVYRPDGLDVDGTQTPYVLKATGESLTPAVAKKYQALLEKVSGERLDIYKSGKADGLSDEAIRAKLQDFDRSLPDSYKALVGRSDMVDPATRYMNPTHDETMGGPQQPI